MSTLKTGTSAVAWRPDVHTFTPGDVIPEALILQASTVAGTVNGDAPSVRVAYIEDDSAEFFAEAELITDSEPTLAERIIYTAKASQLVRLSSEQWSQDSTAQQISQSVARAIIARADEAFVAQTAPIGPAVAPAAGLINVAGVIDGGDVQDSLDVLVDLIATLQGNGSNPNLIVLDPLGWSALRRLKTDSTDSNQSLLGAGTTDAPQRLLGIPVVVNRHVPSHHGLVIDSSSVVSAVGSVNIAVSEHAAFASDSVLVRATWRFGHNVVRPNRVGFFTVQEPGT